MAEHPAGARRPGPHRARPPNSPGSGRRAPGDTLTGRAGVTIWFGGLTTRHEQLILAALQGLGYSAGVIATPTKADYQAGREFGNHGQCNPTYFTVGALVNHLRRMRDVDGIPLQEILERHVFMTAGACGPCRFGMYEAEFQLALRHAGFDGFRVVLFEQKGGLNQARNASEMRFDLPFFLSLINAFLIGDVLNDVAYAVRPYAVDAGRADEVLARCLALCQDAMRSRGDAVPRAGWRAWLSARMARIGAADAIRRYAEQLTGAHYTGVLTSCRALIDAEIEVDYLRPRPVCKITGEFWAQITEGDGNFRMFRFLEHEGAEVRVEPVTAWLMYMMHQAMIASSDRAGLPLHGTAHGAGLPLHGTVPAAGRRARLASAMASRWSQAVLRLAQRLLRREHDRYRAALGDIAPALADQFALQRMAHPYYNTRAAGGEGHLEVAEAIYYGTRQLCHLVLSLKPFGCMPSTQSDGAQAAVAAHYPELLFLPIETSGEGDIGAYSRVQMALGEATHRSAEEFARAVAASGYSLADLRAFIATRPDLRRPLQRLSPRTGFAGRAAMFALHVGDRMRRAVGAPGTDAA